MPINMRCSSCGKMLSAPASAAGKKAKCPSCGQVMIVPNAAPPAGELVAPPPPSAPSSPQVSIDPSARLPSNPSRVSTSAIVDCTCGAKVSLPAESAGRAIRCPQCNNGIALSTENQALPSRIWNQNEGQSSCPICQSPIADGEAVVNCPQCEQVHHLECWAEIGGCGTYGCKQAPSLEKAPATSPPLSAWGDTKKCPVCGETIKSIAVKCRYCQTSFGTSDPLTMRDLHQRDQRKKSQHGLATSVYVLFGLTIVLFCLAPIMFAVNCAVFLPKRHELARLGPLYPILAYSAIGIAVIYSVLELLFWIFGGT
jgi:predicted RNA-binding Zn-ribbon protein involved in translation (DUF1610 family)